ncbi:anosmin-1-like, partial [Diaphorina citri]|uniref:Anosmin-1-like n=1 Tax=Diaphorina citri TaxID=121845 RepID=A0A3Q0JE78_DIACI
QVHLSFSDLPPIPSKITHHEKNNHSSIVIHWQGSREYPNIFYVIQERHHLGVQFREEKLGDWSPGFVVGKPRLKKKYVFVPGRWYQVRVAAVNMHGSRGFSPPSEAFTMSRQPKPPGVPLNLKFEAVNLVRGKYWVELHWDPPVSELPLNNYIIYWSTFLQPTDSMDHKPAPVITHHEVISPDQTHFSIPDLDPSKNLFYIRVQALSVFGTRRLKSVMADKIFSPANYTEVDTLELPVMSTSKRKKRLGVKKSLPDFKVERMFTQRQELFAKLSWSGVAEGVTDHYTVTWSSNKCDNVSRSVSTDVSANVNRSVFTASTDNHWYTIHGLKYNCKYRASVKTHHHRLLFSSSITFTTPQCTPGHPCSKVFTSTVS